MHVAGSACVAQEQEPEPPMLGTLLTTMEPAILDLRNTT